MSALFPADCRICASPLATISRLPVCRSCLDSIQPMHVPACSICGERLFAGWTSGAAEPPLCGPCRHERPAYTRAVAFGAYEGALRELVHLLKYVGVRPAAAVLGALLGEALLGLSGDFAEAPPVAIPAPLHSSKLRSRGFNQAEAIARVALKPFRTARLQAVELNCRALERVRNTQSQTGLTRAQRRANVHGAFSVVRPGDLAGRDVVLIDDVFTTGTTAGECARVLKGAGANRVFICTVARVFAPEPARMVHPERLLAAAAHA
ncbi:MAG: ComF family protein [Acidobacteria bacterium]|nr:ComF family protein [Acidobacteriota bacterium]